MRVFSEETFATTWPGKGKNSYTQNTTYSVVIQSGFAILLSGTQAFVEWAIATIVAATAASCSAATPSRSASIERHYVHLFFSHSILPYQSLATSHQYFVRI